MDLEEFIDIQGYEGLYKINRNGDIFSVKRNNMIKDHIDKNIGYYIVTLYKDRERKPFLLHRLIALHFIPNPDNHPVIDHIDRNRTNNNIENLRWCTYSDNSKNREIKGCIYKEIHKHKEKDYIYYRVRVRGKQIGQFKTYEEAKECLKKYLEENKE